MSNTKVIQDYYPELIHQVVLFNAPASASRLITILSSILNKRMLAKIRLLPVGQAYSEMVQRLNARALWSWITQTAQATDLNSLVLARGTEEYAVRWLSKGQALRWTVTVKDKNILFR